MLKTEELSKTDKHIKSDKNRKSVEYSKADENTKSDEYRLKDMGEEALLDLAELFKMFADSTRIKILYDLFDGEKNVGELCRDIEMNQSAVSHQLRALKTAKLVKSRRDGKAIYYALDDEHVKTIIAMGKEHIEE
ncbi:MAG: helix-turn-helix transcriptional regulator [Mogibacterium sp.]|nr:helix-turn-helix transcriptional regulator [Mogibacterium sp.]